jgi:hypothetical protein
MIFTFHGCQKDFGENTIDIFSQSEAKEWYYGTFKKSPEWQQSNEKGKKLPDWKNGTYRRVGNMEIVEFPLMKERKTHSIPSASKLSISDISKIADGSLSRIVFIRTSNIEIFVRELDYIPNIDFLKLKGYDISDIELGNRENNFSGRIITKKWDGTILSTRISENGKITKTGKRINNVNLKSLSLTSATKDNCEYIVTEDYEKICFFSLVGDDVWEFLRCTEWEPTGNYSIDEYCYSDTYECDYGSTESCECQLYGMGCEGNSDVGNDGDGSDSDDGLSNIVVVNMPDEPFTNIQEVLDCFNIGSGAYLRIYSTEPNPGSGDTHSGTYVGHSFISIIQGNTVCTVGFYPEEETVNPLTNTTSDSILGNDGGNIFSVNVGVPITGEQLGNIINYISSASNSTYNLNTYNCTDFAIQVGNLGGIPLPDCYGSWPYGGGSNPGVLGEYIRNHHELGAINTTTSTALNSNQGC